MFTQVASASCDYIMQKDRLTFVWIKSQCCVQTVFQNAKAQIFQIQILRCLIHTIKVIMHSAELYLFNVAEILKAVRTLVSILSYKKVF